MINELLEVQQFLNGENISKDSLQRVCYLLACWYKEQGYDHLQIREAIFAWANKYHYYLDFSVNSVIYRVMDQNAKLRSGTDVFVSKEDVEQIKSRFDTKNVRLTALALLCYAKAFAERDGKFNISTAALGNWIKISRTNISYFYLKELVDFGYAEKVERVKKTYTWNKKTVAKSLILRLKVPYTNKGEYKLVDNDILSLYNEIFDSSKDEQNLKDVD